MARICGVCKTEKMFTITRGDKIICVECHNKEALSPQTEQAEASNLSDLLCCIARHLMNPDDIELHKWAVKGAYLLSKLERLDPERYEKEMARRAI